MSHPKLGSLRYLKSPPQISAFHATLFGKSRSHSKEELTHIAQHWTWKWDFIKLFDRLGILKICVSILKIKKVKQLFEFTEYKPVLRSLGTNIGGAHTF